MDSAKTLQKLEQSVREGKFYEAQQVYKAKHARCMSTKKYVEAMDLIQSGASLQLKYGQVTCGIELGVLLVETFAKAELKYSESAIDRIKSILNDFPRITQERLYSFEANGFQKTSEAYVEAKTRIDGFCTLAKKAIKWSIDAGGPSRGPPSLHDMLAEYIWTQSPDLDIGKALFHFVRGSDPRKFAAAIVEYLEKWKLEDADLITAKGVLLYLSLGNLRDANGLMHEIRQEMACQAYIEAPLMQFVKYLLLTLERDALPLFRMLREHYKSYLAKDPTLDVCLDAIAEVFYQVHRKSGFQGMLGDFVKMFAAE